MTMVCMWSGPRNLSTAMMRSFGARADTAVWDEPFFAPYLIATGKSHPGRAETLERHETDPRTVAAACQGTVPNNKHYYFQKHMPHHMIADFPMDWARGGKHFFLIRDPQRVIASYAKGRSRFDESDLGFSDQRRVYDYLQGMSGQDIPVIDSMDILTAPEIALSVLCQALDIPFDHAMLSWPAGPRPDDGAWAPYWYDSVIASTGFSSPPRTMPILDPQYEPLLKACRADFMPLYAKRLILRS